MPASSPASGKTGFTDKLQTNLRTLPCDCGNHRGSRYLNRATGNTDKRGEASERIVITRKSRDSITSEESDPVSRV